MIPAWQRIDRDELLVELRRTADRCDVLLVRGNDEAGRVVAGNLASEFLEVDLELEVVRCHERQSRPMDLRDRFLDCWKQASPSLPSRAVPPWLTTRSFISIDEVIDQIADGGRGTPRAYVFDTVDRFAALRTTHLLYFRSLAVAAAAPVIVVLRSESRSDTHGLFVTDLGRMTPLDVEAKLYPVRHFLAVPVAALDAIMVEVRAAANDEGTLAAQDVYDIVGSRLALEPAK